MNRLALSVAIAGLLSGCGLLVPYDDEFMCNMADDYGRCTDVEGAYSAALGGDVVATVEGEAEDKASKKSGKRKKGDAAASRVPAIDPAVNRYKRAEYNELASMIESPVTPMVQPPHVLRTLIIGYAPQQTEFFSPRFIFYFASEGGFVLGDYLADQSPLVSPTLFPNGGQ